MRSVTLLAVGFIVVALLWTIQIPFSPYLLVQSFKNADCDCAVVEEALRNAPAASPALRYGLNSDLANIRLRCARLLALRDDPAGEKYLLEVLHAEDAHAEGATAVAEVYLLSMWEQRNGPLVADRARLARVESSGDDAGELKVLKELLARYPRWIGGLVRRARLYQHNGEPLEARRDALLALLKDSSQFEAMVILAQVDLSINAPDDAYLCMDQAVRVNPQLRRDQRDVIREIIRTLNAERERQRRERRRETPVL